MNPHIIIFAAVYHPYKGGYVEGIHELAKRLATKDIRITVVTCNTHDAPVSENIDGVAILRVPCWNPTWLNESFPIPKLLKTYTTIRQHILAKKINAVSIQTRFFPLTWIGFVYGKMHRIPVFLTERGACHPAASSFIIRFSGKIIDHTIGWVVAHFSEYTIG